MKYIYFFSGYKKWYHKQFYGASWRIQHQPISGAAQVLKGIENQQERKKLNSPKNRDLASLGNQHQAKIKQNWHKTSQNNAMRKLKNTKIKIENLGVLGISSK